MTPEAKARLNIDKMLNESGYVLQDMKELNPIAALGVAVREFPTNSGPVDYLLFIDGRPVGVVEAKAEDKGVSLLTAAEQSSRYVRSGLKYMSNIPDIRFAYESTGVVTNFCDLGDEKARSRSVFAFHRPETLLSWLKDTSTLRNRLKAFPPFDTQGFRDCQVQAILNLEKSFFDNKPRALIQMATGAGKTFTAITAVYRLLKYARANRVLFLVDTKNLGEQAEGEFFNYKPSDDGRLFPELYHVRRLNSSYIPIDAKVCISTIQRMYSILRGEDIDEVTEEIPLNELKTTERPREIVYNSKYPSEFFDIIIIDECHRSIYNVWQQVLDYYDAFLIGLTATPDQRTFGFFKQNIVSEYSHEQAVIDDVNVGREGTYVIETQIGRKGGVILKQTVEKRDRLSRKKRWEQLDEDLNYKPSQLDRDVVNPTQIRSIIREFKYTVLTTMFPTRKEVPKTLVFAKTDSHADDIINIIREEFGEGNDFCKKVTYAATEDPKSVLNAFRNGYYPRIAVTVDMIATGTDVKPIECLIFMRDVRSKNYYEQMLGRATRTLDHENLRLVSPSATQRKLGYVLVDAVGVTKSQKTSSRQLERKPGLPLLKLMRNVTMGEHDADTLTSLAWRLIKLDKVMTSVEKEKFKTLCVEEKITIEKQMKDGSSELFQVENISPKAIAVTLLNAFDEDVLLETARKKYNLSENEEATEKQLSLISKQLSSTASKPFYNARLRYYIENVRKDHDQVVDNENIDEITFSGWDAEHSVKAEQKVDRFSQFIEDNRSNIEALEIIYSQSYRSRPLTLKMVKELYEVIQKAPYHLTTEKLWRAYSIHRPDKVKEKNVVNQLADIISLIRFELGHTQELNVFSSEVNVRFQSWIWNQNKGHGQFTDEQTEWLRMIRDHIATSMYITIDDLDFTPFDSRGGLGKFYQLFGNEYESILSELNYALVA